MALFLATTSGVLGESVMSIELRVSRQARTVETLAASLDRSAVAQYRENARVAAVAAVAAAEAALETQQRIAAEEAAKAKAAAVQTVTRFHLWIPSLGIDRPVGFYACGRTSEPANYVYRWGCAGRNNTYLLGHAWGVFKALHDAYTSGRLQKGMVAYYADGNGRVTRYQVTAWQVVWPWDAAWAMAAQPIPSMTLQTCMGGNSQYRLDVRLVSF